MIYAVWLGNAFSRVAHSTHMRTKGSANYTPCGQKISDWTEHYFRYGSFVSWNSLDQTKVRLCKRCFER